MTTAQQYKKIISSIPGGMQLSLNDYIPHDPTPKQTAFLLLDRHREVFYGGAAGGGKSDALLMAALQHVNNPFYNAIIFRKTFTDLKLPGALIDRALEWLLGTDARWSGSEHRWYFPSGASIGFGYLESAQHKFRYQSAEFQFIAFDELTHHYEEDYLYLFSRLRKGTCTKHQLDETGEPIYVDDCHECSLRRSIPLRMRTASNPGGLGHIWVKKRFGIKKIGDLYLGTNPKRPYLPAFLKDNPFLNQKDYIESLQELDPVTREQLLRGDWGVSADGRIKKHWLKRYFTRGDHIILNSPGSKAFLKGTCMVYQTIDPAASAREGPGDDYNWRRLPSYTVIATWLLTQRGQLVLWHVNRYRKEIPETLALVKSTFKELMDQDLQPSFIGIEADGLGIGVYQILKSAGLPVMEIRTRGRDKLVRCTDFITRCEQGTVFLPEDAPWLEDVEAELFTWTGHPDETDDVIDACGHAGNIATTWAGGGLPAIEGVNYPLPEAY